MIIIAIDLVATLRLNDEMSSSLKKMAGIASVGFAGIAAGAAASVKTFVDFDTELRKAGAIAGASAVEFDAMKQSAMDLGASTSKSASEVAVAFTEMAAKGFNANQVIAAMPGVIAAAEASGEDLALAADTVSSALNIWGLEASESSRVADVLAMAANKSAAGIGDMQLAFKYTGAASAALGISLEETAAAIGLVVDAGGDGSSAGTALRAGIMALSAPLEKQQKLMGKIGFSATNADKSTKSLSEMVGALGASLEGMPESTKIGVLKDLVGLEATPAFLTLLKAGPEGLDAMTESLVNSGGAAQKASDEMTAGLGGAFDELGGAMETFKIKIGDSMYEPLADFVRKLSSIDTTEFITKTGEIVSKAVEVGKAFKDNWPAIKEAIIGVTTAVVAFKVGMLGLAIVQTVTALIKAYQAGTLLATAAQLLFNGAMSANPIGLIIMGIAALIGIIVVLYRNWDTVTAKMKEVWAAIGSGSGFIALILGPLGFLINAAIDLAKNWDSSKSIWENVWGAIQRSAATSINAVVGLINKMIETINKIPGVNIPIVAKVDWGAATAPSDLGAAGISNAKGGAKSHYNGIEYVPYDGYQATLHRGEEVVTAREAKAKRGMAAGGSPISISGNTFHVRQESDIDDIAMKIVRLIEREGGQMA